MGDPSIGLADKLRIELGLAPGNPLGSEAVAWLERRVDGLSDALNTEANLLEDEEPSVQVRMHR